MDAESGRFVGAGEARPWMPFFTIGEVLKVKSEDFEVFEIHERRLVLKPLSAQERRERLFTAALVASARELRARVARTGDPVMSRRERRAAEKRERRAAKRRREGR